MRGLNTKSIAIVILAILVIYGLFAGFMYSLNFDLGSDTVVPGIVAMEVFNHGDIQFDFPVNDPYLFTDIYTFHLLPQLLSGYDPTVLRLTAFAMFLILIAIFSYIIYRYAGTVSALMFAALMANLSPDAYTYFISPEWHEGTLIATGIFIILLNFDRIKKSSMYWTAACVIAAALVMLSDSTFLALFIIPYIAYYILFKRAELQKSLSKKKAGKQGNGTVDISDKGGQKNTDIILLSVALIPTLAWLFKTYEPTSLGLWMPYFDSTPVSLVGIQYALTVNLPLYFQCITFLVSQAWYNVLGLHIGLLDIPMALIFIAALGISVVRTNKNARYLYMMFLVAAIVMFLGFVFSSLTDGLWSSRFLIYTALSVFAVIALGYDEKDESNKLNLVLLGLVVVLVLSTVPLNYSRLVSLDSHPNQDENQLISFLESRGYNFGYSDYANANLLTYLSKEQVTVRSVRIQNGKIDPYPWLAAVKWYNVHPSKFFILSKTGTEFNGGLFVLVNAHPPSLVETYKGYNVFYFNSSS